jgi:hypothetical protein
MWVEANMSIINPATQRIETKTGMLTRWQVPFDSTLDLAPINFDIPEWLNNPNWWQMIYGTAPVDYAGLYNNFTPFSTINFEVWQVTPPYLGIQAVSYGFQPFLQSSASTALPPSFTIQVLLQEQDLVYSGNSWASPVLWLQVISLPAGNQGGTTIPNFLPTAASNTLSGSNNAQNFSFRFVDALEQPLLAITTIYSVVVQLSVTAQKR